MFNRHSAGWVWHPEEGGALNPNAMGPTDPQKRSKSEKPRGGGGGPLGEGNVGTGNAGLGNVGAGSSVLGNAGEPRSFDSQPGETPTIEE